MVNSQNLPTPIAVKAQAKRLRTKLQADGTPISHSKALEMLAHQHGFKNWNSFNATLQKQAPPLIVPNGYHVGDRVQGRYLGQSFRGHIHGVEAIGSDHMRLTLDFDEPVDVVSFDSFSAFRKRVQCVIGPKGQTLQKTSNGEPQLCLGKA